jgi:hypothetical protein
MLGGREAVSERGPLRGQVAKPQMLYFFFNEKNKRSDVKK